MTFLYWLLKQLGPLACKVYFSEIKVSNEHVVPNDTPVIFVANHPSSLMDPIICGSYITRPLFFLGRADLFQSKLFSIFLRQAHMWPIYRSIDGVDTLSKNKGVFEDCYQSLAENNSIILYGEGFTDEQFVRRVKNLKKGAARIAIGAELTHNFELDLKIVAVGINYTNPEVLGGDISINFAEPISIQDYKEKHDQNPVKCFLEITTEIEKRLQSQVIHCNDPNDTVGAERVLMLDQNSMHYRSDQGVTSVDQRWQRSKQTVDEINSWDPEKKRLLFSRLEQFWNKFKCNGEELFIVKSLNGQKIEMFPDILYLVIGLPFALIGLALNFPLFLLLNILPKMITMRSTFYPGMQIAFGIVLSPLLLFIEYLVLDSYVDQPYLFPAVFFLGLFTGVYSVKYWLLLRRMKDKLTARRILKKQDFKCLQDEYLSLTGMLKQTK